ncbi:RHS repeat-associated core domain-containing protein [Candidatus Kuenenia stuttgartiensis]|nr:RHS repeat-associated core domain-containing protein [Candidatus Kuenenia stuttgartiensis]
MNEYVDFKGASQAHDNNGNLTDDGTNTYVYDFANRLYTVSRKTDSAVISAYTYDASGRRIRKVVSNSGDLDGTTNFYLDGWREIEERDDADSVLQQYVFGMYIDEPLVLNRNVDSDDSATSAGDEQLFYHQNTLYSIFALTDNNGEVVEGYQYDAYGLQTVFESGANGTVDFDGDDVVTSGGIGSIDNPYLFTGRRLDPETGVYYYRMRYMNADQGRFVSRDPIGYDTGLLLYEYVGGQPTVRVDPFGLRSQDPCPSGSGWTRRSMPSDDPNDNKFLRAGDYEIAGPSWGGKRYWKPSFSLNYEWVEPPNFQRPQSGCGEGVEGSWSLYFEESSQHSFQITGGVEKAPYQVQGSYSYSFGSTIGNATSWNGKKEGEACKEFLLIGLIEKVSEMKSYYHPYYRGSAPPPEASNGIYTRSVGYAVCERPCGTPQTRNK